MKLRFGLRKSIFCLEEDNYQNEVNMLANKMIDRNEQRIYLILKDSSSLNLNKISIKYLSWHLIFYICIAPENLKPITY